MQSLAITGASGFLGRHLTAEGVREGRFHLRLLTRARAALSDLRNDAVTICEGDLLQPESLNDFLHPGSTLIHLAYIHGDKGANLRATENLIEAARRARVARVVYCSTAVVVGFATRGTISEQTPARPENDYQRTKYAIEGMLRDQLVPDVDVAILRPTEIFGPGGTGLKPMIRRLRGGSPFKNCVYRFLLRSRRFNYVSVYNVVAALILLVTTPVRQTGEVYFISDDDDPDNNYASVEQIIRAALGHRPGHCPDVGLSPALLPLLFKFLQGHSTPNRVYSHDKISALGYRRRMPLRQAIEQLVASQEVSAL